MTSDDAIALFEKNAGLLRTSEALAQGVHPRTLYRLRDEGVITTVSRGIYRLSSLPPLSDPDLVTVALRVPRGVICLVSALSFHGISDEIPHEVHIALPRGAKKPRLDHPPIHVYQFGSDAFAAGIESAEVDGVRVQVYCVAKTIADCFRFRNSIGTDVAVQGLREGLHKGVSPAEILKYARICRIETVILPYLEGLQ